MGIPLEIYEWAKKKRDVIKVAARLSQDDAPKPDKQPRADTLESKVDVSSLFDKSKKEKFAEQTIVIGGTESLLEPLPLRPDAVPDTIFQDQPLIARTAFNALEYKYGLTRALASGQFALWPNEVTEVTCGTQRDINYWVNRACNLNPIMRDFDGFREAGTDMIGTHSLVEITVDGVQWAMCQQWHLLGPITWDSANRKFTVRNIPEIDGGRVRTFQYTLVESPTEEQWAEKIHYFRSESGAISMFVRGQRAGIPKIDGWKTHESNNTPWYVWFNEDDNSVRSLIPLQRPLVQNKGLESIITVDEDGRILSENVVGHWYRTDGWAEFHDAVPMFMLDMRTVEQLIKGLVDDEEKESAGVRMDKAGKPVESRVQRHVAFEEGMQQAWLDGKSEFELEMEAQERTANPEHITFEDAVTQSWQRVTALRSAGDVRKFVLVEAWYQIQRKNEGHEFIYPESLRDDALLKASSASGKGGNEYGAQIMRGLGRAKRIAKLDKKRQLGSRTQFGRWFIDDRFIEHDDVKRFLNALNNHDLVLYQLEQGRRFCDEAADRVIFVKSVISPRIAGKMENLEREVRTLAGDRFDAWMMASYARIVGEFLGMMAYAWNELSLTKYKDVLVRKVNAYNGISPQALGK